MLQALSKIWESCALDWPEEDLGEILHLIEELQSKIFVLGR